MARKPSRQNRLNDRTMMVLRSSNVSLRSVAESSDNGFDLRDDLTSKNSNDDQNALAQTETRAVRRLKALFLSLLALLALTVSVVVYQYVTRSERAEFETSFHDDATKLLASFGAALEKTLSSADAFAVSVVSHANETGQQWPYVVMPNFAIRAGKVRDSTNAFIVNLYMYVKDEERAMWENFTAANNYWVEQSIDIQASNPHYQGPITREYTNFNVIHGYDEYEKDNPGEFGTNTSGPYLVWWQCYPVIAYDSPYNWELFTSQTSDKFADAVFREKKTIVREPYMIWLDSNSKEVKEADLEEAEWLRDYVHPGEEV
jgi:hypothetical protein